MSHRAIQYATCAFVLGACASSNQGEEVRDARMERIDERAAVQEEEIEERAKKQAEAVDDSYDQLEEKVSEADQPGGEGTQELLDISQERTAYVDQMETRLDKLSVQLSTAQQKIDVLGARAPDKLRTELQTAAKQHEQIKSEVSKLNSTPASNWDSKTEELDEQAEALDERVSDLSESIDDM